MAHITKKYDFIAEFFDIDSMGVMWHGNYVRYMEAARCRFLDEVGFSYLKMKEAGFALPVVKLDCKYIAPIEFNKRFCIEVELLEFECFFRLGYRFVDISGARLCQAHTSQVAILLESKETCLYLPSEFRESLSAFINHAK
ncbi:acyl-CoA thioesterase [Helicobacter macacae]|uniref:Thioesterase domain-containing protein n=1 Tax=Helicobacter macacae MIT 99-5501 TaxID=1357400 RepID=V8CCJ3_9HELI|nr:acyl-CoA thioesterase [Helicobacter macacae]ETD25069.1 hypothetical protein HMPREF2086_00404 [Helicobacter macacae MIT 99-5501]